MREPILIGNGQGFWGDSIDAPIKLIEGGEIHYLTLDYLAEVTMSIMQRQKQRDANRGFATDFVELMREVLPVIVERDIKIIASAGGVNPTGCRNAVMQVASDLGLSGLRVGIVEGDDILERLPDIISAGEHLNNLETGAELKTIREKVLSANVYISTMPIVEALRQEAQVVITGRATDPGLVLAPMIYEFNWADDDWDKLAAGTVAGHILECGAQATGGNFTRWWEVPDFANIGYPIAEVFSDGSFNVTKHPGTGGQVTKDTVSEQIVYEMGDPTNYISPDVTVDFTTINLEEIEKNKVRVTGIKGGPATESYKVSISYHNGYKASGTLTISGPDAIAKANKCGEIIMQRLANAGIVVEDSNIELLGINGCHGNITPVPESVSEVVLRISVKDRDKEKVLRFGKEIAPLVTNGPPGVTGFAGGRPKPQSIVAYWPALLNKTIVSTQVSVEVV